MIQKNAVHEVKIIMLNSENRYKKHYWEILRKWRLNFYCYTDNHWADNSEEKI